MKIESRVEKCRRSRLLVLTIAIVIFVSLLIFAAQSLVSQELLSQKEDFQDELSLVFREAGFSRQRAEEVLEELESRNDLSLKEAVLRDEIRRRLKNSPKS